MLYKNIIWLYIPVIPHAFIALLLSTGHLPPITSPMQDKQKNTDRCYLKESLGPSYLKLIIEMHILVYFLFA